MLTFVALSPSVLPSESRRCDLFIKFYRRVQSRPLVFESPPASCGFFSYSVAGPVFAIMSGQSGGYSGSAPICSLGDFATLLHHLFLSVDVGMSLQQYPVYSRTACCAMYLVFSLSFGCRSNLLCTILIRNMLRHIWFRVALRTMCTAHAVNYLSVISVTTSMPVLCRSYPFISHLVVFLQILACISPRSMLRPVSLHLVVLPNDVMYIPAQPVASCMFRAALLTVCTAHGPQVAVHLAFG
ncbi:hypothetical protein EDD85DRAFT_547509 [Armillaria nabsnona]|nr:hypothetical protein EDD85DRAFT_547509 [Armillaria nabsnona]